MITLISKFEHKSGTTIMKLSSQVGLEFLTIILVLWTIFCPKTNLTKESTGSFCVVCVIFVILLVLNGRFLAHLR